MKVEYTELSYVKLTNRIHLSPNPKIIPKIQLKLTKIFPMGSVKRLEISLKIENEFDCKVVEEAIQIFPGKYLVLKQLANLS
jgi:hypothetical protein